MPQPLVSVIIANHNGIEFVDRCLGSVLASDYPNFEIIFVDNASTDGSLERAREEFGRDSRLRFIENKASLGPAVARNRGAAIAAGKYLLFLDNDTQARKDVISELVRVLETDTSIGSAQAKLLRMDTQDLYDCAGDYLGPLGFLIERSRGAQDSGQFDFLADILSAKSAASIIRRDIFERIGGFDEDFYMYLEETDLSWRVWISGSRVVFIPGAVVYHAFNTPKKEFKRYYPKYVVRYNGCRNYISTLIKNLELLNLLKMLPAHVACWALLALVFIFKGAFKDGFYIFKGIGWNIFHAPLLLRKRRYINTALRKARDREILERVMDKRSASYYLGKAAAYVRGRAF